METYVHLQNTKLSVIPFKLPKSLSGNEKHCPEGNTHRRHEAISVL